MPNLIYLGNYNSVDTSENNWASEGAQSLVGISTNSSQMDIVNANVSDGGDGVVSDDDYGTNDYVQYYIDGQYFCTKTDSTMTANVTLTLSDGSTQVVEVVMMQQQNGDLFISDLLNCGTLDNLSIANVEISAITGDCYSGWYSDQSVDNTTLAPVTPNNDGYVDGTAGDDVIDGSYVDQDGDRVDANDQILPGAGEDDDYIRAGAGNDFVLAGDGDDEVYGGTGDDTLCGQDGDDTLFGEAGNDTLEGMNGNDIVYGGAGDDRITGDAGDDALTGGSGDDSISGGTGDDVIYGDRNGEDEATVAGRESFNWEGRSDSEIDGGYAMNTGSVTVTYDRIQDTGDHQSSLGDATLNTTGINSGGETVDNDSSLRSVTDGCGNEGAFSWDFSAPVENVSFNVNDIDGDGVVRILAYDANGNQIPVVLTGGNRLTLLDTDSVAGADTADSNGGYDDTNTSDYNLNVSIQGPVSRIVLEHDQDGDNNSGINVTDIYFDSTDTTGGNGADGNDVIAGGAGEDLIYGEGGADTISGGADDDTVYGGAGDDSISGNNGDDFLLGGDGDDNINGGNGNDTLCGNDGDDVLTGGAGNDILEGMNDNDVLFGGTGDDRIYGDAGNDEAHGGDGDDSIYGGSGDDTLDGGNGDDLIKAGSGDDTVQGGAGDDSIEGGTGDDLLCGDDEDTSIGRVDELTLQWNEVASNGTELGASQTYGVGGMNVTVGFAQEDQGAIGCIETTPMYVESGENFDPNSGLYLYGLGGEGGVDNTSTTSLTFASDDAAYGDEVQDVSFRINDIDNGTDADDHIDIVTVRAYDADGNEVAVTITPESNLQIVNGNTVTGGVEHSAGVTPASQLGSVLYNVEGPVARIEIDYDNGESTDQRIDVTDINFFTTPSAPIPGEAGNDVISGGAGDDDIYGKAGDDTLSGDAGNDNIFGGADRDVILGGAGDNVDGGAGGDDYDILDVTGQGTFILTGPDGTGDPIPDSNGNGFDGQVVFVDANGTPTGEVIDFVEIEEIRGDQANAGPIATDDAFTGTEDDPSQIVGNVITGDTGNGTDTDPDGDELTVSEVNGDPAGVGQPVAGSDGGLVTINPDGTVSFDPNGAFDELGEGEEATTTVTYTVTDPDGAESTATVTFTVTGTNDAPTAVADVFTADEDDITDLGNVVDANDTDPEDDPLTVAQVNGDPANVGQPVAGDNGGLVTINEDGTASFDPNGEFEALGEGEEATTEVTYTITDPDGATSTTTVTVTVTGTNDAPTAVADTFDADETDPADLGNVLGNDIDPEDDPLTVSEVNGDPTLVGTPVPADGGGLVTINEDGSISFDPNGEFEELGEGETADVTVTYTATDPDGETSSTTVTITVNGVNDGPDATDNAYVVNLTEAAGDVDGNVITDDTGDGVDSDPENDDLTVVAVGGSAAGVSTPVAGDNGGLFTINPDGTVDFDTNGDFDGLGLNATEETSVTYTIRDENGLEDTATVTFTVTGTNDGTVQGTAGDDVINPDIPYVDADGDIVDAGDAILPGDVGDDDLIYGFGGNDSIDAGNGDDEVYGGTGNDTIEGGDGDDWVSGGTGNDVVDGGAGNDTLNGNQGDDTLNGGDGDDVVNGGFGDDSIEGGAGDDVLNGEDGDDTIRGGTGNDMVNGGEGDDDLYGGAGNDKIEGSEGDDTLTGGSGDDDIWGGLDDDTLYGGSGDDTLGGGAGNDVIEDNIGNDVVEGGDGDDVINVGNTVNPALDYDYGSIPFGDNDAAPNNDLDTVFGGAGNDIISTGDDADSIDGGEGDDIIDAGIDDDSVTGGTGNDTIIGGQGEDIIEGNEGDDLIYGGLEDEVLTLPDAIDEAPDDNRDTIYGGLGNDTIFGRDDADTLYGGEGNDILDGGIDDDEIWGDDGDDTIYGGQGNDVINGGVGQDLIYGGEGDDTIQGNMDDDAIYGDEGNDTITGSLDDDLVYGGADDDEIRGGTGDDTLHGDEGDDYIQGGFGDDSIYGGDGEDSLNGGFGADIIEGGDGNDTIAGFDGEDTIIGGAGEDTLYGGQNSDVFLGGNGGDVVKGGEDPDDSDVDVLDLTGSNVDFITYTDGDPESGVVTFLDGSTMTFSEIENVIPCFTPGTTIATAKGERLVEELVEGDRIITRDNGIQEIAWVGHKEMTGKQLVQNPHLKPILIKAGALGNGLPERDMMVSPNHRVLVASELTQLYFEENEVLAAAKHMVGAEGIHAVDVMSTTYVHFMFERHEVVLSNGAWTESFQPGDYSLKGIGNSQRNEIMELFPELNTKTGLEGYQSARKALKKHEAKLLIK